MPGGPEDLAEERTVEGMRIIRIGIGQYRCFSETQVGHAYNVDIMDYDGLGSCTCWDFEARRFPRYRNIRKLYDMCRCKHIRRIRNHVFDQIIAHTKEKNISSRRPPRESKNLTTTEFD